MNLNALDHVKKNKGMYLSSQDKCGEELAYNLADDARTLGVNDVEVTRIASWWVVYSEKDWLTIEVDNNSINDLFTNLVPLVGGGVNALRREVLVNAFASDVVAYKKGEQLVVKGEAMPDKEFKKLTEVVPNSHRVVAFRE